MFDVKRKWMNRKLTTIFNSYIHEIVAIFCGIGQWKRFFFLEQQQQYAGREKSQLNNNSFINKLIKIQFDGKGLILITMQKCSRLAVFSLFACCYNRLLYLFINLLILWTNFINQIICLQQITYGSVIAVTE